MMSSCNIVLFVPDCFHQSKGLKVSPTLLDEKLYTCSKIISQIVISSEKFDI